MGVVRNDTRTTNGPFRCDRTTTMYELSQRHHPTGSSTVFGALAGPSCARAAGTLRRAQGPRFANASMTVIARGADGVVCSG